jgi:predicted  nucleic acid-binding Zn-ribbon protein
MEIDLITPPSTRERQNRSRNAPTARQPKNKPASDIVRRKRTADEAFTGVLAASKAFQDALDGFTAARNEHSESIEDLGKSTAWKIDNEKSELENKVEELSDALDMEKTAHQARMLSFEYLWAWNTRLEGQHEFEIQELKEAGRRLADENMGLRAEMADMEKRCTNLYELLVQELRDRHENKPIALREILQSLHNAFGGPDLANEATQE